MKLLFYCIWVLWSVIIMYAILYNHYAEFYLTTKQIELLFNEYAYHWAFINAIITFGWIILTWIGLYLFYKNDKR